MEKANKKISVVIATALFLSPAVSFAWEQSMTSSWEPSFMTQEQKVDYYGQFKQELYEQLLQWDFSQLDKKIKWYQADIEYLAQNPESEHYKNIIIYKEKLAALEDLRKNFISVSQELPKKNELNDAFTPEQMKLADEFKKSLEESIQKLRETLTSENVEDVKTKAENLKAEYLQKAKELWLDRYKQMVEARFQTFYQNNFAKNDAMKKMVEEKKLLLEKAKIEMNKKMEEAKNKMKEKQQELKEIKKEDVKRVIEEKKQDFNKIKENFQVKKQDLKAKYKEQFAKQLQARLDKLPVEKLQSVIEKIDLSIEKYTANDKLTSQQKEKFIAQLHALKEIVQEKISQKDEMINLDELLGE